MRPLNEWSTPVDSTVLYTGGSTVGGTVFVTVFLTLTTILIILYMRNK
mgnify:FL=1